ncbi:hypothetical protein VQ03_21960 [Methylobacterium tarhaniae]|uniref:Uncharacterized protein n=1 Tax=Methylobacterium tarhaniae TaxID=1187852 RepID=A0A0J6SP25_9HYPH|nr:hypothetical protein VQ03_21960 [Methylobacterium tarhaniae]
MRRDLGGGRRRDGGDGVRHRGRLRFRLGTTLSCGLHRRPETGLPAFLRRDRAKRERARALRLPEHPIRPACGGAGL